ncbi:Pyridine nucleotide-disulfide oxidoreductase, FAD/NAD(P)-binding domain protein [Metarhizium album ARSEF 1941]|uniref:Pyridine nucleotide-disulfide oxidoreductase, FAD/NAD(P)-binding domain protein n=1 Tax=Metarhizium album (strain ARSEF 1941) TaxID=1081103 RepID=A0A0B2WVH5_METAS|nr:Pyridine nucleotide-disulfide oxidoreductase, FAD/NAD(P)-binding domain protein [Metarhizium album ARSEF 1941]KHN98073.1 Pyridine nucleotide-disulfide oxidoreductase, FAD/NAD(P)-binding domain protein [Metarhizium album ARSEF 1941]
MSKTVVVLGGSLGGLAVTHRLLKYTLPHEPHLKVILITKNSNFYWNLASVRAVIPDVLGDEQIMQPIEPGLAQYPPDSIEFILGEVTGLDAASRTAHLSTSDDTRTVTYDYLVIATGSTSKSPCMPWKASSTHEACVESLHKTAESIRRASHVVVAGAGATGVELAAEIRFEFRDKTVVLLSSDEQLLGGDCIASAAERELVKLGVSIRRSVRVAGTEDREDGKTIVRLEGGQEMETELYLPTMGFVPNTAYLPGSFLNDSGYVHVDEYMGVAAKDAEGRVWAVGDAVSKPRAGFLITEAQAAGVAKNIDLVLRGQAQQAVRGPLVDAFICSTGRSRTAGRLGFVPMPSLAGWIAKGRTLGVDRTKKLGCTA